MVADQLNMPWSAVSADIPRSWVVFLLILIFATPLAALSQTRDDVERQIQQEMKLEKRISTLKGWRIGALNSLNRETHICILVDGDLNCPEVAEAQRRLAELDRQIDEATVTYRLFLRGYR
jgi:hypothetical protein